MRLVSRIARAAVAWDVGVGVVGTLGTFRGIVWRDLESIALVAPVTVVVARPRVLVEVALL